MIPYIVFYFIVILSWLCAKLLKFNNFNNQKVILVVSFLVLVCLMGLRHQSMGIDLSNSAGTGYLASFEVIASMNINDVLLMDKFLNYEKGFVLFNNFIGCLWTDRQFFLSMCFFFPSVAVFYTMLKKSTNALLSVVIFVGLPCFLYYFSALRQAIALSFCFFSLVYIINKKPWKFFFVVAFASTFHHSAIVFFIAYPIYNIKLKMITRVMLVLLVPLVFLFKNNLIFILASLINKTPVLRDTGALNLLLVLILIYIFCLFNINKKDDIQIGLLNVFFLACLCQVFGSIYDTAVRVTVYYMLPLVILLPMVLDNIKNYKYRFALSLIVFLAFVANGLFGLYSTSWAMAYPYYFYWETI